MHSNIIPIRLNLREFFACSERGTDSAQKNVGPLEPANLGVLVKLLGGGGAKVSGTKRQNWTLMCVENMLKYLDVSPTSGSINIRLNVLGNNRCHRYWFNPTNNPTSAAERSAGPADRPPSAHFPRNVWTVGLLCRLKKQMERNKK